MLRFTKMNGAGNDFVLLDNRAGDIALDRNQIAQFCDRHRGVGADGVLVLENPTNGADFRMRYYNADGGEAEMCGNGARCFARFANKVGGQKAKLSFETPAGVIGAELKGELVTLRMSEPTICGSISTYRWRMKKRSFTSSTAACRMSSSPSRKSMMPMCDATAQRSGTTKCFHRTAQT